MEKKYIKLAKNTAIFTIGSFTTKALSFLIVPLYTYVLATEEYGRIDLFFTAGSLLASLLTLQIHQAMMRFLLGKETKDEIALSNSMAVFAVEVVISLLFLPVYILAFKNTELGILFFLNLLFSSFNIVFSDYLLVVEKSVLYALKGIIVTIVLLSSNVVALVFLKLGVRGYIYANILSQFIGSVFLLSTKLYRGKIRFRFVDIDMLQQMLKYCIPLIPNSLMWWIMSSGDKFVIYFFLGDSANGLYSLALKVPTIISMMYSFFIQAWVISAIEENNSQEKKQFYENIYRITTGMLVSVVAIITLFVRPLFTTVMGAEYKSAWMFVPLLSLATAISSQTTFFAVFYTISKKTKKVFYTTLIGTVVNIVTNIALVRVLGLQGIAIGTCVGYTVVLVIRMKDSRELFEIDLDIGRMMLGALALLVQIPVTIIGNSITGGIVGLLCCAIIVAMYRKEIMTLFRQISMKLQTMRKR